MPYKYGKEQRANLKPSEAYKILSLEKPSVKRDVRRKKLNGIRKKEKARS